MSKIQQGEIRNPNGRPRNTGHRQQVFNTLVMPHKEALFSKAIDLALNGSETMLKLFIERMIPARPIDETVHLNVPSELTFEATSEMAKEVLHLLGEEEITPVQAKRLFDLVQFYQENIAAHDLLILYKKLNETINQQKNK